jgi:hypothetical protein
MPATLADAVSMLVNSNVLGMNSTDVRITGYVNEAIQRLLPKGKWVGTTSRMRFCVYSQCITMPRQVETIETYAIGGRPGDIRNEWYEFLPNGPGLGQCDNCGSTALLPRGFAPAFNDIRTKSSTIWVKSDQIEATGLQILLEGYDENGLWVRTSQGGVMADGELVSITSAGAFTTTRWAVSGLSVVLKPATQGFVSLWELEPTMGAMRQLANYEPDELQPRYRRYMLPNCTGSGSGTTSCCDDTPADAKAMCIDAIVKLAYIKAINVNDILIIGCLPAIKDMVQSIRFAENNLLPASMQYEAKAVKTLQDELESHMGDGPMPVPKFPDREIWGVGSVGEIFPH